VLGAEHGVPAILTWSGQPLGVARDG
jgi:hypothetical protein